ncbi:hypothetical protein ACEPAF_3339 [Sanghuangporus sanghuang]
MRVKQVWTAFPLPAKLKLFWERVTFSRMTKFYFFFSVLHCLVQLVFQIQAFSTNARAANFLWHLVTQANTADPGFSVFSDDELRFCESVPDGITTASCQLIWAAAKNNGNSERSGESGSSTTSLVEPSGPSSSSSSTSESESPKTATIRLATSATPSSAVPFFSSSTALGTSSAAASTSSTISATSSAAVFLTTTSSVSSILSITVPTSSAIPSAPSSSVAAVVGEEDDDDELSDDDDDDLESIASVDSLDSVESLDEEELEKRDHPDFRIAAVDANGTTEVVIDGFGFDNQIVTLSRRCLYTLNWPVETLNNTKREDITFIAFQFWVLGMSIVAILNESIPHIIASLLTHVLATAWGGFQIWHTNDFRENFVKLTAQGACDGTNLLSTYWKPRANAEIASLVLNAVALVLSGFLSWKLFKLFGWQTFKRVGASRTINRVYKLVLTLSIAIQLSLFFIVVSIALWLDSLCNGVVGRLSKNPTLFKGLTVAVIVLLIPWLTLGWISVRRELRVQMLIFLVLSLGYMVGWAAMFTSPTFRWTFVLWRFFTLMTVASVALTLSTLVIGILCRINFGKGLPRYLNAEEALPDNFEPVTPRGQVYDDEKVEFPSGRAALPTYSAAFAQNTPPRQMKFSPARVGPRFTNPSIEPFEIDSSSRGTILTDISDLPGTYVQRSNDSGYQTETIYSRDTYSRQTVPDGATLYDQRQLARQMSVGSQRSYSSTSTSSIVKAHGSKHSYGSDSGQRNDPFSKRWMIE